MASRNVYKQSSDANEMIRYITIVFVSGGLCITSICSQSEATDTKTPTHLEWEGRARKSIYTWNEHGCSRCMCP